jgi:hypothetical protein
MKVSTHRSAVPGVELCDVGLRHALQVIFSFILEAVATWNDTDAGSGEKLTVTVVVRGQADRLVFDCEPGERIYSN